ncbi:MAG: hypothetical protein KDD22_07760, partial [Bdellovibrionales bacterium]|nr:hypothetical protein [Bdellovibrionales bacterium]
MFFKPRRLAFIPIIFCGLILLSSFGCGLKIGEQNAKNPEISVGADEKFSCIRNMGSTISQYMEAKLSEERLNTFFDCMQYSFTSFEVYVSGRSDEGYQPAELKKFFEEHFLKNKKISDALMQAFMELKVAVVGGRVDFLKRSEVKSAVEGLETLRRIAIRLRPVIPILNPRIGESEWPVLKKTNDLEKVRGDLEWAARELSTVFSSAQGSYSFGSFQNLMSEFRGFLDWEAYFTETQSPEHWIGLVRIVKGIVSTSANDQILPAEWGPLFDAGTFAYLQYLRFRYQIVKLPLFYGEGLKELSAFSFESTEFLVRVMAKRPGQRIE